MSKHGIDLFFLTIVNPARFNRWRDLLVRTVSHRVVFGEILEIASLHSKQVVDLFDRFSHASEQTGHATILLSDECS